MILLPALTKPLKDAGFSDETIEALRSAMANASVDPYAESYAHGMYSAYNRYGIEGVKTNIMYLLLNLKKWKGDEARKAKNVLRKIQ